MISAPRPGWWSGFATPRSTEIGEAPVAAGRCPAAPERAQLELVEQEQEETMSLIHPTKSLAFALAVAASAASAQQPAGPPPGSAPSAFAVEVKTIDPVHALVLPMKGSYLQHPEAFGRLGSYLSAKGIQPAGPAIGIYFSDPSVGEENLVWEVGFPVPAGLAAEAPYQVKDLPARLCAVHVHKGPMEELGTAWGGLVAWVTSNGYQPIGPAMQVFTGGMAGPGEVELRMPVKK
jgi:effector-binding domain-containing protein